MTLLLVSACASTPRFDQTGVNLSLAPKVAAAQPTGGKNNRIIWGGTIVESHNEIEFTELEVLAYPLDAQQRPKSSSTPEGRFRARRNGYLETADYAPGREITLTGVLQNPVADRVGEASYVFPVVEVDQLQLWNRETAAYSNPNVHFGIGVVIGN
jgi:outer membrane lipoprotein